MAFRSKPKLTGGIKDPSSVSTSVFHMASVSPVSSNALSSYPTPSGPGYTSVKRRLPLRKVENGSTLDWLEAMKDSSPPRVRCLRTDAYDKSDIDVVDMEYRTWMVITLLPCFDSCHGSAFVHSLMFSWIAFVYHKP